MDRREPGGGGPQAMTDDESAPAPRMRPELTALVNWLRSIGRMADVDYGRLLHEIVAIGRRAAIKASGHCPSQGVYLMGGLHSPPLLRSWVTASMMTRYQPRQARRG
jgi:hypothetical protein